MSHKNIRQSALVLLIALTFLVISVSAQTDNVLYSFQGGGGGLNPTSGLVVDAAGHFYGTIAGPANGNVFEFRRLSSGEWVANTLFTFTGANGAGPQASNLLMDAKGSLYGTTVAGGDYGHGVVFKLIHTATGWKEIVLHNFNFDGVTFFDGSSPKSNLIMDKNGDLFGTTEFGGRGQCSNNSAAKTPKGEIPSGCGTVFKLVPHTDGSWSERILYNFQGSTDGGLPLAGLVFGQKGDLYGTTSQGGAGTNNQCFNNFDNGCGVIFSLSGNGKGGWNEEVLYSFSGLTDGANPVAGLTRDSSGNLYGTTGGAGAFAENSTVFKLTPTSSGWVESTIYSFPNDESNGYSPQAGVVIDAKGNLYGTTIYGSASTSSSTPPPPKNIGVGIVFKLAPASGGTYTESDIHSFSGSPDGATPSSGKLLLRNGKLYGTTTVGGSANLGTIFTVAP